MSKQPAEQPACLGDGAYARWDDQEIVIYTDRRELHPDGSVATVRHWIALDRNAMRELVALADQQWPNWR